MGDKRSRLGREQTTAAILDAAEALFAEHGYTAVTIRKIAAAAGVSHALVHRYLGSKEEVYRATLRRHETALRDAAGESDDLFDVTGTMAHEALLRKRRYLRLVAHSALHGLSYERTMGKFVATERLVDLADAAAADNQREPGAPSPRFVVASIVAMLLGWAAAREWLFKAASVEEMSDEEFAAAFERVVCDVERLYLPSLKVPERE